MTFLFGAFGEKIARRSRHWQGQYPLHWASQQGDVSTARKLITQGGAGVDDRDGLGQTPLIVACSYGSVAVVSLLLDRGASVEAPDAHMASPLHHARSASVAKLLIDWSPALVSKKNNKGWTPLHFACAADRKDVVELLVQRGARVNERSFGNLTPFYVACQHGCTRVVRYLCLVQRLSAIDAPSTELTPLYAACAYGHTGCLKVLLSDWRCRGWEANSFLITIASGRNQLKVASLLMQSRPDLVKGDSPSAIPLCLACGSGHVDMARLLLAKGAEVEARDNMGRTALHLACAEGFEAVVRLLLEKGAEINTRDRKKLTPLQTACKHGKFAVAEILTLKGANLNIRGYQNRTALHICCVVGHLDLAQLLIEKGASVAVKTPRGRTPLHDACGSGHLALVELLIQNGADIEARENGERDRTPLHVAGIAGNRDIARLLIECGAQVDARTRHNLSPLHLSCFSKGKGVAVAELLVDSNANIDAQDCYGRTPLFKAAESGDIAMVQLLLERGAAAEIVAFGWSCRTPLHVASCRGRTQLMDLLIRYGPAAVNKRDSRGEIPLHSACSNGLCDAADMLVSYGSYLHLASEDGHSPLELALSAGHTELVQQLLGRQEPQKMISTVHWAAQFDDFQPLSNFLLGACKPFVAPRLQSEVIGYAVGSTALDIAVKNGHWTWYLDACKGSLLVHHTLTLPQRLLPGEESCVDLFVQQMMTLLDT